MAGVTGQLPAAAVERVGKAAVMVLKDQKAYAAQFHKTFAQFRSPQPAPEHVDFESR